MVSPLNRLQEGLDSFAGIKTPAGDHLREGRGHNHRRLRPSPDKGEGNGKSSPLQVSRPAPDCRLRTPYKHQPAELFPERLPRPPLKKPTWCLWRRFTTWPRLNRGRRWTRKSWCARSASREPAPDTRMTLRRSLISWGRTSAGGDVILIMSNGGFGGIYKRLPEKINSRNLVRPAGS